MSQPIHPPTSDEIRLSLFAVIIAYCLWSIFPIYFKQIISVSSFEILAHRIIWSLPFALGLIALKRQWADLRRALKVKRLLGLLALSSLALAVNWGLYVWAIHQNQIFQSSLGYYINPLISVVFGVLLFHERLSRLQQVSIISALTGVGILTIYGGVFPFIALILASSFAAYGVIRKKADIAAMPGLAIETLWLFTPAALFLCWQGVSGRLSFGFEGTAITGLLLLLGPITILPLWGFAFAARRLKLSTLGILQYIGPTGQFLCALYYGEAFTLAHAWCFGFIWLGVGLFSYDAYRRREPSHLIPARINTSPAPKEPAPHHKHSQK